MKEDPEKLPLFATTCWQEITRGIIIITWLYQMPMP